MFAWPGRWRADDVEPERPDPSRWSRQTTARACAGADQGDRTAHERATPSCTGTMWRADEAHRDADDPPLLWLDGGLDVRVNNKMRGESA